MKGHSLQEWLEQTKPFFSLCNVKGRIFPSFAASIVFSDSDFLFKGVFVTFTFVAPFKVGLTFSIFFLKLANWLFAFFLIFFSTSSFFSNFCIALSFFLFYFFCPLYCFSKSNILPKIEFEFPSVISILFFGFLTFLAYVVGVSSAAGFIGVLHCFSKHFFRNLEFPPNLGLSLQNLHEPQSFFTWQEEHVPQSFFLFWMIFCLLPQV